MDPPKHQRVGKVVGFAEKRPSFLPVLRMDDVPCGTAIAVHELVGRVAADGLDRTADVFKPRLWMQPRPEEGIGGTVRELAKSFFTLAKFQFVGAPVEGSAEEGRGILDHQDLRGGEASRFPRPPGQDTERGWAEIDWHRDATEHDAAPSLPSPSGGG